MLKWIKVGGLSVVGWSAIALWAYGITVLQPLTEPGPSNDLGSVKNTYWVRDLRWAAILAAIAVLIVVARGNGPRSLFIVLGAVGWLAADIGLDRPAVGPQAYVPMAVIGCAVFAAVVVLLETFPGDPGRRALTITIACCAVTGCAVAGLDSLEITKPLVPARSTAAALLMGMALIGALAAAPTVSRRRLKVAIGTGILMPGLYVLLFESWPDLIAPYPWIFLGTWAPLFVAVLEDSSWWDVLWIAESAFVSAFFTAVWLLSRKWSGWRTAVGGFAGVAAVLPLVTLVSFFLWVQIQGAEWPGLLEIDQGYSTIVNGLIIVALASLGHKLSGYVLIQPTKSTDSPSRRPPDAAG